MRRRGGVVLALFGFVMTVGAQAWSAEPIKIGAIFSVTGPAAFLGDPEKKTVKMLEEQINKAGGLLGRKVEIIVYDDETDATKALTAFDRLIKKDGVVAVVGPSTTGTTLAVVSKAEEAKIPLIACGAAKKIITPHKKWVFKTPQNDEIAVKAIYKHAKKNGITKVAIITASDGYGAGGREELKLLAPQMGIEIVADEVFGPKDTDMTVSLTKIGGSGAQAIICWGTNPGPAVIARNRMALGMKIPLYNSLGVGSKKFIELAGIDATEGLLVSVGRLLVADQVPASNPQRNVLLRYKKEYEGMFKEEVSTYGGHSWDAVMMLAQAIKTANSADPAAIRDAMEKIKHFQGTGGEFNMSPTDHGGLADDAIVIVKIVKGEWQLIN
jgi:branched-chain amino acid transport system substrate-binding protein